MKNFFATIAAFGIFAVALQAQQEQQYTQFMFNKMGYNPGYAGSFEAPAVSALFRSQWLGLDGAPSTQVLSYSQQLLNKHVGLGGNLVRNSIGINRSITLDVAYSYRIEMRKGWLGVGVQASMRHLNQNWSDPRLKGTQDLSTDQAVPMEPESKVLPNFGFGLFYSEERFFAGLSVPRLVANNIDFAQTGNVLSREAQHFYLMGGYNFTLNEAVDLLPQVLFKYVKNAPLDLDVNCNAMFNERFLAGLTYRVGGGKTSGAGESLDLLAGIQVNDKLYLGLSYDIGLTKLRKYNNGSIEATARYYLIAPSDEGAEKVNPRYGW